MIKENFTIEIESEKEITCIDDLLQYHKEDVDICAAFGTFGDRKYLFIDKDMVSVINNEIIPTKWVVPDKLEDFKKVLIEALIKLDMWEEK